MAGAVSVVIPAHDEAAVIERCLHALANGHAGRPLEIIVVCNGCGDDTADRARRALPSATVLELAEPSKVAALDAGDHAAIAFPRFYVDADVVLSGDDVAQVADALERGGALCAAPRPRFDVEGRPWAVRAFYRVWVRLPYLRDAPVGNGVYALSAAGRRRFQHFPAITADDLWIQSLFKDDERVVVDGATFVVHTPRSLRGLYRIRVRAHRGTLELRRAGAAVADIGAGSIRAALGLCRSLRMVPAVAIYLLVNLAARATAERRVSAGEMAWERDDTGRTPLDRFGEGRSAVQDAGEESPLSAEPSTPSWSNPPGLAVARPEPARGEAEQLELWSQPRLHQVGPLTASLRRPMLLVFMVLLVLVPSVQLAIGKAPTWKAESRLLIGRLDVESTGVPGFVSASNSLAATYSRLAGGSGVAALIATKLHQPVAAIRGHVTASPIPESPIIRVETNASSEREALLLGAAADAALADYVSQISASSSRSQGLLDEYTKASADLTRAGVDRDARQREFDAAKAAAVPRAATVLPAKPGAKAVVVPAAPVSADAGARLAAAQQALGEAQAKLDGAKLKADSLSQLYQSSQRGLADTGVSVVQEPQSIGSDRRSSLALGVATGLLGGLVLGVALVTLIENRPAIRALRQRRAAPTA